MPAFSEPQPERHSMPSPHVEFSVSREVNRLRDIVRADEYNLEWYEQRCISADREAALTTWQHVRGSVICAAWAAPVAAAGFTVAGILHWSRDAGSGFGMLAIIAAFVTLCAIGGFLEALGNARGGAAEVAAADREARDAAAVRLDEHSRDLAAAKAKEAAIIAEFHASPSNSDLLSMVIGTAARDLPAIASDAQLWAAALGNIDDDTAWAALAGRNNWASELTGSIRDAQRAGTTPTPPLMQREPTTFDDPMAVSLGLPTR